MRRLMDYISDYLLFIPHWTLKSLWLVLGLFYILSKVFPEAVWWWYIILLLTMSYNSFLNKRKRGILRLFRMPPLIEKNRKVIFKLAVLIEGIFMLVAVYILHRGLQTITGVQERLFGLAFLDLSLIMAIAISLFMFWLLYAINNTYLSRLIIAYIALDAVILMPFNFMFLYENNQNENLVAFQGREIPPLSKKLNIRYSVKRSDAAAKLTAAEFKNRDADTAINNLTREKEELSKRRDEAVKAELSPSFYDNEIKRINRDLKRLRSSRDTFVHFKASDKKKYDDIADDLQALRPAIDSIEKRYSKESYIRSVSFAKDRILTIAASDSIVLKDTAISRPIAVLQTMPDAPADAFIDLLHDLAELPVKLFEDSSSNSLDSTAQSSPEQLWRMKQKQSRWFSFVPSILVDIIPLITAIFAGALRKRFET